MPRSSRIATASPHVVGARAIAEAAGVPLIEDAAQHAGGQLAGRPLGAFGPLTTSASDGEKGDRGQGGRAARDG